MTGTDRLRAIAGAWDEWGLGGTLAEIADQIERERACDADTIENIRLIVGGVVDEMEHHILGHEGMEDSPVARWARELRGALKSYASDERDTQNPSWHDPADAADVTSDAPKVTRDPAEDVSMSAYDLLPADEREAIAWVREHGGLESVKKLLDWVVGHCSTKQQLDFDFWLSGRVMYELGFEEDMADRDEVERRLLARLMPEGMEWLVEAWPRFEDDLPVGLLDDFERYGEENGVSAVTVYADGSYALNFRAYSKGERVNRPAPKVLDADGAEIRVGDVLYSVETGGSVTVDGIEPGNPWFATTDGTLQHCAKFTHRAPVLAADGKPLRGGETVWGTKGNGPYIIDAIEGDGVVRIKGNDLDYLGADFTHHRPAPDANGVPIRVGDTVWDNHGEELVVLGLSGGLVRCRFNGETCIDSVDDDKWEPSQLTHEPPDSWDALWDDIEDCAVGYESFMRRCKALAERGEA